MHHGLMRRLGRLLAGPALLLAAALPATAGIADPGWSVGAAALFGQYKLDSGGIDDNAMGFKASAEYRLNSHFGVEGSFLNTSDFSGDTTPGIEGGEARLTARGFGLDLVAYLPYAPQAVQAFGKVGYYRLKQDLEVDGESFGNSVAKGFSLGAGVDLEVADQWAVRLAGDWYKLDDADFWTVGLGLRYRFARP